MKRALILIILGLMLFNSVMPLSFAYSSDPKIIYVDDDNIKGP